jgi:hypothetical protein
MRHLFARRRASTTADLPTMANGPELNRDRRKALLVGREDEVGTTEALLFRHDPIGINFGDNTDEYRPEAETITLRRAEATSLALVRTVVHQEFTRWFDTTAGPDTAYEEVARELHCFWNRECTPSRSTLIGQAELLRIWSPGRGDRFLNPDEIGVEWCGRGGHPSSYAFVVGRRTEGDSSIALRYEDRHRFHGSLAGICDEVKWGLPDEFRSALLNAIGSGIEVTVAAHGLIGSSIRAFERVGRMLNELLQSHHDEHDVWAMWRAVSSS